MMCTREPEDGGVLRQTIVFTHPCASSVRADLTYDLTEPYAITINFRDCVRSSWLIDRELLGKAFKAPAGVADVRMSIDTETHQLRVELRSDEGTATLFVDPTVVYLFLRATHDLVEPGTEDIAAVMDDFLAEVLEAPPFPGFRSTP